MEQLFLQGYDAVLDMATGSSSLPGLESVDLPDHALIWNLCGLPAVSAPAATSPDGLPLGVQLVARRFNDKLLLELLRFLDQQDLIPARTHPEPPMAAMARNGPTSGRHSITENAREGCR